MNKLIEYFAKQGIFVTLISIFITLMGIISTINIKREVFPNVDMDMVTVTVLYPGASADSIEKLITNPIEQDLTEVDGIKKKFSVSSEGIGYILMQIDADQTTTAKAKDEIEDIVDAISLPEGAEKPNVKTIESKLTPTIEVALAADLPEIEIRQAAKFLERELEKLPSVARANLNGIRDIEYRIEADSKKLRDHQLSLSELITAISKQNINLPGGSIEATPENNFTETIVRTVNEYETLDEILSTVVRSNTLGEVIRIKDVATATQAFEKQKVNYRINGLPGMSLTILKKEAADSIETVNQVKATIEIIRHQLNPAIKVSYINDQSFYVSRRISVLSSNLLFGLGLVLLILSMILPLKVGLVAAFGIPFSFLGTMILFDFSGISLNLISMMGLIIVVGMLVDDAIVVTENAQRLREEGHSSMDAAIKGTQQIWAPVTVSVMTTMMAFGPLMFMSGIFGKFVKNIPIGVLVALAISLLECFFILPHHLGAWIKDKKAGESSGGLLSHWWDRFIARPYEKFTFTIIKMRYVILTAAISFFFFSIYFAINHLPFVLFPPGGVEVFTVNIEGPSGSSLKNTANLIAPIEKGLLGLPKNEIKDLTTKVGEQKVGNNDPRSKKGSEYAQIMVYLTPEAERARSAAEIISTFKEKFKPDPRIKRIAFEQVSGGPPVGKPINIGVRGENYDEILSVVSKVETFVKGIKGVKEIENTFVKGKNELHLKLNEERLASSGLTIQDVGNAVRSSLEGVVATTIKRLNDEIDVRVSLDKKDRTQANTIKDILIPNQRGALIRLGTVADFSEAQGIATYQHQNGLREVAVTGEINTEVTTAQAVNKQVKAKEAELLNGFPNIRLYYGGEDEDTSESLSSLQRVFTFAVLGIALMLIALFQNLHQPIVVMATIPLGIVSVIWTFSFHSMPLSFLGMIGVVALAGVIVNNAIVFVDFVNQARRDGFSHRESIRIAAKRRFRPICLTTITTVAGILPTAYGLGGGKDPFVVPIAMSLGWGVCFGSLLTLIVLPSIIAITDDLIELGQKTLRVFRKSN